MSAPSRRSLLKAVPLAAALHPAIARALDIPAKRVTGTIKDVAHIVILTQENRAFDHYFGTLSGVRGFGDRFPIPLPDTQARKNATVWVQPDARDGITAPVLPFHVDTQANFKLMRLEGTPHTFADAQAAWDDGRMDAWPKAKHNHAMAYFTRADIPFQFALAEAFTLCDAYHCALHAGTDPNRLFIWTGTNDPDGKGHGPVIYNAYDELASDEHGHGGYEWITYPERLQAAGIDWQIYQNMANNFDDNPLVGFKLYRHADKATDGPLVDIARRSLRTRDLDKLKEDVLADKLPQVSWVVAPDLFSEHPGPSSPAQGADYTARVLDALTANPEVWAKTVLIVNFDENDGLFDHVPPPSVPSRNADGTFRGASQVETAGEYYDVGKDEPLRHRAYGLGPRVPFYAVSPWSKGGFVSSEVFDHTSVIRFIETRFGVKEPNITPWRRAVCGDLTSCFDFSLPDDQSFVHGLPATKDASDRATALPGRSTPDLPAAAAPVQDEGVRRRRPTPYQLEATAIADGSDLAVTFDNRSPVRAVVFHVYDRRDLAAGPARYTVAAGSSLKARFEGSDQDLWILGPNGFHRHFIGHGGVVTAVMTAEGLRLHNSMAAPVTLKITDEAYGRPPQAVTLAAGAGQVLPIDLAASHDWYDFMVRGETSHIRLAGHIEDGRASVSDPAAHGPARLEQPPRIA